MNSKMYFAITSFIFATSGLFIGLFVLLPTLLVTLFFAVSYFLRIMSLSPSRIILKTRNLLVDVLLGADAIAVIFLLNALKSFIQILLTLKNLLNISFLSTNLLFLIMALIFIAAAFPIFDRYWLNKVKINNKCKKQQDVHNSQIMQGTILPAMLLSLLPGPFMVLLNLLFTAPRLMDLAPLRHKTTHLSIILNSMDVEKRLWNVLPEIVSSHKGQLKLGLPMFFLIPSYFYSFLNLHTVIVSEWTLPYVLLLSPGILSIYLTNTRLLNSVTPRVVGILSSPFALLLVLPFLSRTFLFMVPIVATLEINGAETAVVGTVLRINYGFLVLFTTIPTYVAVMVSLVTLWEENNVAMTRTKTIIRDWITLFDFLGIGIIGYFAIVYLECATEGKSAFFSIHSVAILIISIIAGVIATISKKYNQVS